MTTLDALWGTITRRWLTSTCAAIAGIATVVTTVPPAWTAMGLPEWASKRYVGEQIEPVKTFAKNLFDPLLQAESKLEIAQAQTTQTLNQIYLSQLQSSLYAAQQDEAKAPSRTIEERIAEIQRQIADVQTKVGGSR